MVICAVAACSRDRAPPRPAPQPEPAATSEPIREAAGDTGVRVLLAEVASAKACEMIRGRFRGLRAHDRRGVVTGVLWIRDCRITSDGTRVTYAIAGNGWQWTDQTKHEAGGTFVVRQYVKFAVKVSIVGTLDVAYDPASHVVSLWFTPTRSPRIAFDPVDQVEVDRQGLWSSVVGAVASVFSESPDARGTRSATRQGTDRFESQLAGGMSLAIDACTGYQRFSLGRAPKGSLGPPSAGDTSAVQVEVQPGGVFVFGPELAPHGMTIDVRAQQGPVLVDLACADRAEQVAEAFLRGAAPSPIGALAERLVRDHDRLHIGPTRCKVAVVARSVTPQPVTFEWRRPRREKARAQGGPLIDCREARK